MDPPDIVLVGHVTRDLLPGGGWRPGGSVVFGAHLAARWGFRPAVLTSAASEEEARAALPPETELIVISSAATTTFHNVPGVHRTQYVSAVASGLFVEAIPEAWRDAPVVLVAPVMGEVPVHFVPRLGSRGVVAASLQGWLRRIDEDGRVRAVDARDAPVDELSAHCDAVFVSDEDLAATPDSDSALRRLLHDRTYVLLTRGSAGTSILTASGQSYLPAVPAAMVDETGAGDIFATAYLLSVHMGDEPRVAARIAQGAAAIAIERPALDQLPAREEARLRATRETRVVAIANQKGGVGKTTTTVNLAAALAQAGYAVLVVDLDPQRNATSSLGIRENVESGVYDALLDGIPVDELTLPTEAGFALLPASVDLAGADVELVGELAREMRLRRALEPIVGEYDYIFVDCPPSLGLLTLNALAAADEVLVPVQCEYLALEGLGQLKGTLDLVRRNLNEKLRLSGIVLTMFDRRTTLSHEVAAEVRRHFPETYETAIPRSVRLSEAPSYGKTVLAYEPNSRGAQAYRELADEIAARRGTVTHPAIGGDG